MRRWTPLALCFLALLAVADRPVMAQFPSPSQFVVLPNYGTNAIDLSWQDVSGETGYIIERQDDGAAPQVIATPAMNATSFIDTNVNTTTEYVYCIKATSIYTLTGPGGPVSNSKACR